MANEVYANGREISCKAGSGKSICAFPDVCFTPPQTPVTPPGVPIPYPNTGIASDTTDGSKTIKISGKEVMLKDKSYFKQSYGDEAGCASKKGIMTSVNRGKVFFTSWSFDIIIEGENVVRHLDLTTHNHASYPSNTTPWPYADNMAFTAGGACENDSEECKLVPYKDGCPEGKTPHHVIPVHCFMGKGARSLPKAQRIEKQFDGCKNYDPNLAPCICVEGSGKVGQHGNIHAVFDKIEDSHLLSLEPRKAGNWDYKEAKEAGKQSIKDKCSDGCIELQLKNYHEQDEVGIKENTKLRADSSGRGTDKAYRPSNCPPDDFN